MSKRLTVNRIKQIIQEEKSKLKDDGLISRNTVENAWSGGDNLVKKIDYIKQLEIKESKLRKKADIYKKLSRKLKESIGRKR